MQVSHSIIIFLLAGQASAATLGQPVNSPVTRVVQLLEDLAKQQREEEKKEEDLYESFVCWGKSVVEQKTATNKAARAKIQELETYIADIDAGRIEFTTERVDLEKEMEEITAEIEAAEALREKEHNEFLDAEKELNLAIAALDKAITVLKEATKGHEEGVFAQAQVKAGLTQRVKDAELLDHAIGICSKLLTAGDAMFLRRLLTGDVPTWDWKKLNRKATFKMGYKARSLKIQEVLEKMQSTFSASLADAQAKEKKAQEVYDALMKTKTEQQKATAEALQKMEEEMGVRGLTKEESQAEIDALKEQVANDEMFIEQTTTALAEKKEEWKDRKTLRAEEQEAFSKAIAILHNDDARDLMKRSFESQSYSFLQEGSQTRGQSAAQVLRRAAQEAKDMRLAALATRLVSASGSHFTEVIEIIDKMVETLKEEENVDLERKETCEKNRMEDTRDAILKARAADESTDTITQLTAEIEELEAEIKAKLEEIARIEEELAEAKRIREDENAAWKLTDKDDTDAAATVREAKEVLSKFYSDNNLMLVQKKGKAPVVEAGMAPPPPPQTWDAPYGGKTEQASGIIAILEMVAEDIDSDKAKAKKAEDEAQAEFEAFEKECLAQIESLKEDIARLEKVKADKEESKAQEISLRATTKGELYSVLQTIKDAEPGCDYFCINYPLRVKNRQIEIDGLRKAKAILQGAKFDAPDPNRELKPGDAFMQRRRA